MLKTALRQYYRDIQTFYLRKIRGRSGVHPKAHVMRRCGLSPDVVMGAYAHLSPGCQIGAGARLGNYVMCGPNVKIALGEHSFDKPGTPIIFSGKSVVKTTEIGDDVWIGANSLIRSGVTIGRGAVVAMGSVVVKDVEPYSVVGGVPVRLLSMRFDEDEISIHEAMLSDTPKQGVYCERSRS